MPKKSKSVREGEAKQVARYRMRLLARNREYQSDIASAEKEYRKRLKRDGPKKANAWLMKDKNHQLAAKWEVPVTAISQHMRFGLYSQLAPSPAKPIVLDRNSPLGFAEADLKNFLDVEGGLFIHIDLECQNEEIYNSVKELVDEARKREGVKTQRRLFSDWDRYLKVYDLRKAGKTFSAIANQLSKDAPDALDTDTVRKQYNRAKELIDGGYRKIK